MKKAWGVKKDLKKALDYYMKAINGRVYFDDEDTFNPLTTYRLGKAYFEGDKLVNGEKNYERAFSYLDYTASNASDRYYIDDSFPAYIDNEKLIDIYRMLYECYDKGLGVEQNRFLRDSYEHGIDNLEHLILME